MADVTATAHVWPSANDVEGAQPTGWGKTAYEKNLSTFWLASLGLNNFTIGGAALPASDADLTYPVPTMKFWLDGHFVEVAATNVTFAASNTHHLFAKLLKDGNGNVSSVAYEHNTIGVPPADATPIGTFVTDGDNVTGVTDRRIFGPGSLELLTSGTSWTCPAGIKRIKVITYGAGGGGGGGGSTADGGLPGDGNPGSGGGAGGTTQFNSSAVSANGGSGGGGGQAGTFSHRTAPSGSTAPGEDVSTATGQVTLAGRGMPGGVPGGNGGKGGHGAYAESYLTVTPGTAYTYAIGAAGTAGTGGASVGFGVGADGAAGKAGRIVIRY